MIMREMVASVDHANTKDMCVLSLAGPYGGATIVVCCVGDLRDEIIVSTDATTGPM